MALNFPNSPTDGQIFTDTATGYRWMWDSGNTTWKSTSTYAQTITVSSTQPGSPVIGQLWWNKDYGRLLVYYSDGDSSQWVDASPNDFNAVAAFRHANAAFDSANNVAPQIAPAFNTANAAFASANNVAPQVTPSYNTANAAYNVANNALPNTAGVYTAGGVNVSGNLSVNNFIEFGQTIGYDYTISTGKNALSAGPISIANGNVVTIPSGSVWTVT